MKLELNYPVTTYKVNQEWGVHRPEVYSQFGFTRHNGVDIALGSDSMIYAPAPGQIIRTGNQPRGGGIFIGFLLDGEFTFDDGITAQVLIDFLHLDHIIGKVGVGYDTGDVIAKADNTGFSTGPHTHMQFRRVKYDGKSVNTVDTNDANNSFDPKPFWNGRFPNTATTTIPKPQYEFQTVVNYGSKGRTVQKLQDILRYEGFFSMESTGYFGDVTAKALVRWQTKHGFNDFVGMPLRLVRVGTKSRELLNKLYK